MKYADSEAARCRYGYILLEDYGNWEIIWEKSEHDYSGSASGAALSPDGMQVLIFEWSYGSCSGCDTWEAQDTPESIIIQQMANVCTYEVGMILSDKMKK